MPEHTAAGAPRRRHSPFPWLEDLGFRRGAGRHRLLVADGALPAIAAAACGRRWSRTRYAGVGGVWTGAAALAD